MRVALLSALDSETAQGTERAPFRRFAGSRLIERQLDLASAADCETIVCLTDRLGREVIELQHRAEEAGAKFIAVTEARGVSAAIPTASELLVVAPGVLPEDQAALKHMVKPCVLVFSANAAVPRGYERIDLEFAWSGVLLAQGAIVEELAHLPPDVDPPSALLRLALQAGTRTVPLEKRLLDEGRWHIRPDRTELIQREQRWIKDHAESAPFTAPGLAIADRMAARLARDVLGGKAARLPAIAAGVIGTTALAISLLGLPVIGLGLGALMAVLARMAEAVERIGLAGQVRPHRSGLSKATDWLNDPVLVILAALASPEDTGWLRLFVPAALFALLRLGQAKAIERWRLTYADRISASILLILPAVFGLVQPAAAILAVLVLISLFITIDHADLRQINHDDDTRAE